MMCEDMKNVAWTTKQEDVRILVGKYLEKWSVEEEREVIRTA